MKHIYQLLSFVIAITIFTSFPLYTVAKYDQSTPIIESGYTEEGIYYEVHKLPVIENSFHNYSYSLHAAATSSIYSNYEVIFNGSVTPPRQRYFVDSFSGITYGGTLSLQSLVMKDGKTYATYSGYMYPCN